MNVANVHLSGILGKPNRARGAMITPPRPTATAVYLRVSSEEQRERQTIATQREFIARWCAKEQVSPSEWYADDGISGTIPVEQRPSSQRLFRDARDGKFRTLLIYKLDRLGRDALVILQALDALSKYGVEVRSLTEHLDLKTPHGRFMAVIQSGAAGYERDSIVQRTFEGQERVARSGAWAGGVPPYGYRVAATRQSRHLVPSDEPIAGVALSEADVIRLMYRLCVEDRLSCIKIAEELNRRGVPTVAYREELRHRKNRYGQEPTFRWSSSRVRNILVETVYKGLHRYGKRRGRAGSTIGLDRGIIERPAPALVDDATWEAAQGRLRDNRRFSARNSKHHYLLRGLMRCGLCGLTYVGRTGKVKGGYQRHYYSCAGSMSRERGPYGVRGEKCPSKTLPAEAMEQAIWADIEGIPPGSRPGARETDAAAGRAGRRTCGRHSRARPCCCEPVARHPGA
jgi:site-specific DNA recombinase